MEKNFAFVSPESTHHKISNGNLQQFQNQILHVTILLILLNTQSESGYMGGIRVRSTSINSAVKMTEVITIS